eukprot:gene17713-biopygen12838
MDPLDALERRILNAERSMWRRLGQKILHPAFLHSAILHFAKFTEAPLPLAGVRWKVPGVGTEVKVETQGCRNAEMQDAEMQNALMRFCISAFLHFCISIMKFMVVPLPLAGVRLKVPGVGTEVKVNDMADYGLPSCEMDVLRAQGRFTLRSAFRILPSRSAAFAFSCVLRSAAICQHSAEPARRRGAAAGAVALGAACVTIVLVARALAPPERGEGAGASWAFPYLGQRRRRRPRRSRSRVRTSMRSRSLSRSCSRSRSHGGVYKTRSWA